MCNNVLDSNYSMLLKHPGLHNVKVTHDWGNNLITIEGNNIVWTIIIMKHLDGNIKWPEVLLWYDIMNGVTYKKEEVL
jgi:hypothetical protein